MEQHTVGGFAGWFEAGGPAPVRRWKSAAVVLLGLIPVSLAFLALRRWLFPDLHPVVATVVGNVVGILVLTWLVMPWLTDRLASWLRR